MNSYIYSKATKLPIGQFRGFRPYNTINCCLKRTTYRFTVGNGLRAAPQKIACNFLISEGNNIELVCDSNFTLSDSLSVTHPAIEMAGDALFYSPFSLTLLMMNDLLPGRNWRATQPRISFVML